MVGFRETPSTLVVRLCRVRLCSGMKKIHECLRKGFRMEADMMWASRSGKASCVAIRQWEDNGQSLICPLDGAVEEGRQGYPMGNAIHT